MNNILISIPKLSEDLVNSLTNTLGIWYLIILNAFGVIAMCCKITEYQLKNKKNSILLATCSVFCWTLYFVFQGDFLGAGMNAIGIIMMLIFSQKGKYKWADSKAWLYIFIILQVSYSVLTFKSWKDIFVLIAGPLNVIAYYTLDGKIYRRLACIVMFCWTLNSLLKFYPVALLNDSFATISAFIAIMRYDVLKNKQKSVVSDYNGTEEVAISQKE